MKFTKTGTFRDKFLEEHTSLNLKESFDAIFLDKLDYFLGFLTKEKSEIVSKFVENHIEKFQGLIDVDFSEKSPDDFQDKAKDYENLVQYRKLTKTSINYLIYLLELKDESEWEKDKAEITRKALIQAWTYPSYYLLETLVETIDREEAVKLYKRYITSYYLDHPSPNRDETFSLEKMLEKRLSGDTTSSEWIIVHTMLEEGKYAFKNKNCPTCVDAMTDLPDLELKYLTCCYGDYEKFRSYYSDHIILTMEHTLMEEDPYCSRVLHDTRINYDLRHPPKEFWDNFEPGKEEEAIKYYMNT